jgi:quercetin dioxygenase-like cupin family protein
VTSPATSGATPVVRTSAPASSLAPGVTVMTLLGTAQGCHELQQRRLALAEGTSLSGIAAGYGESWYVLAGAGLLGVVPPETARTTTAPQTTAPQTTAPTTAAAPATAVLRPGTAVWIRQLSRYSCGTTGGAGLLLVAVTVCAGPGDDSGPALRVVTLDSCEPERTGDREFRVLLSAGLTITQFVGLIPPGRAPEHHHTYNEVVYVLAGHGVVHLATGDAVISPGTSIYLPPYQPHCLENTGNDILEVLGVFYPAGSPAAKGPAG